MTDKTEALYTAVLTRIKEIAQEVDPGEFAVEVAISDFEEAIMNSMKSAFLNSDTRGCWFHYGQVRYLKITFYYYFFTFFLHSYLTRQFTEELATKVWQQSTQLAEQFNEL